MSDCYKCKKEIPQDAVYCCYCGAKQELTCAFCGTILPQDAAFCFKCGKPVGEVEEVVEVSAEPKKRGRKAVEKMPQGNPTPGFPNVSGFYKNNDASVSVSDEHIVWYSKKGLTVLDKDFGLQWVKMEHFGFYEMFVASSQNEDGIWLVTQEGCTEDHMPLTLRHLSASPLDYDKKNDKLLQDHAPNLMRRQCVMNGKFFAYCTLEKKDENGKYQNLRIHKFSIPSGRMTTQEISCESFAFEDNVVFGFEKVNRVRTDGLNLYVDVEYATEDSYHGKEPYKCSRNTWLKINLRSAKVENLGDEAIFFDFDRGIMWVDLNGDAFKYAPEYAEIKWEIAGRYYAAKPILPDAQVTSYYPVIAEIGNDGGLGSLDYFDGENGYFIYCNSNSSNPKGYYKAAHVEKEYKFFIPNALVKKEWSHTSKFKCLKNDISSVFWQDKVCTQISNENWNDVLAAYPAWWEEDESYDDMVKEIY